jgi:hypothetical protein
MGKNPQFTFCLQNIMIRGPLDLEGIHQEAQTASATGEGLANFLNADLGLN